MCDLSLVCYDVVLFVFLLRYFICVKTIQTNKKDLIGRRYQIMIIRMLKNWSQLYYSHYIIKFIGFMSIYYVINLDIVSSCMVFSYIYIYILNYRSITSLNQYYYFPFQKNGRAKLSSCYF